MGQNPQLHIAKDDQTGRKAGEYNFQREREQAIHLNRPDGCGYQQTIVLRACCIQKVRYRHRSSRQKMQIHHRDDDHSRETRTTGWNEQLDTTGENGTLKIERNDETSRKLGIS